MRKFEIIREIVAIFIIAIFVCFILKINYLVAVLLSTIGMAIIIAIEKERKKRKSENLFIKVVKEDNLFSLYPLPNKLNNKFKKQFKDNLVLSELDFNTFIINNLSDNEATIYFAHIRHESEKLLITQGIQLNPAHLSYHQTFYIPYKDEFGKICFLNVINEKEITPNHLLSLNEYRNENKLSGMLMKEDLDQWMKTLNN